MKKIFNFIRKPQFFGLSCIVIGSIIFGNIIDIDRFPLWLLIIYIVVFWALASTGFHILTLVDNENQIEKILRSNKIIDSDVNKKTVDVRAKDDRFKSTYVVEEKKNVKDQQKYKT